MRQSPVPSKTARLSYATCAVTTTRCKPTSNRSWPPMPATDRSSTSRSIAPCADESSAKRRRALQLNQPQELRRVARENSRLGHQFAKHIAEIGGQRQVPAFVQLLPLQTGPLAVNLSAAHAVPQQLHLDLSVPDKDALDAAHELVLQLGGTLRLDRSDDEEEPLRVYADPDGHPFCIFVAEDGP